MPNIEQILSNMTFEQKLGQLCIAGICGGEDLDFAKRNFEKYHFGGLMYSPVFQTFVRDRTFVPCGVCKNIPNIEVSRFLHGVKQLSMEIDGIPCMIGGDQEGGMSGSFLRRREMTILPKPMGLAASATAKGDAYLAALIAAREVKAMGYDMLYGPVMDVNINPGNPEVGARSFGDDPEICSELGVEFIKAFADAGVISTSKHFPGRGRGGVDAHYELESFDVDKDTLMNFDLLPFKRVIAAGTEAVMVCHTIFSTIDPELPASISKKVITGILREELGFTGLVIPDTMTMWAISKNFEVARACAMVLEAGADMFFMKDPPRYDAVFAAVKDSLKAGRLTEEDIENKVRKILTIKQKYGLFEKRLDEEKFRKYVGTGEHRKAAAKLAENSTVILKNRDDILPLHKPEEKTALVIVPREMIIVQTNDTNRDHLMLPRALEGTFKEVQHVVVDPEPTELQLFEVLARARNADVIIAGAMVSCWNPGIKAAVKKALELNKPVVALLACAPYVINQVPEELAAVVCTFCEGPEQFASFAKVLNGKLKPTGKCPVKM